MTAIIMAIDDTDDQHSTNRLLRRSRYRYTESVGDGVSGDGLMLPPGEGDATITVVPTTTAKVQFTQSTKEDVENDSATWYDWDSGDVSSTTTKVLSNSVTAIRLVSVSGSASFVVTV